METSADLMDADLRSDGSLIRLQVDSGASDNYVDPYLTPGLQSSMRDCKVLLVPHTIVAAGQNLLEGVATGTLHGTVTDYGGWKQPFLFKPLWYQDYSRHRLVLGHHGDDEGNRYVVSPSQPQVGERRRRSTDAATGH